MIIPVHMYVGYGGSVYVICIDKCVVFVSMHQNTLLVQTLHMSNIAQHVNLLTHIKVCRSVQRYVCWWVGGVCVCMFEQQDN
jgi:hypothetical protein